MTSRRHVLRGAGCLLGLPWFESLKPLAADEPVSRAVRSGPKRLAVMHISNGVHPSWSSKGNGADMQLGDSLAPLNDLKDRLNVYHGLWHKCSNRGGIHPAQAGSILTGVPHRKGMVLGNGVSFDQLIARHTGKQTSLPALVLSCETPTTGSHESGYSMAYSGHMSWNRTDAPCPIELYPSLAFDQLFANTGSRRQQSVLDRVAGHARSLQGELAVFDRYRLDEYLTGVRELERQIEHRRSQEQSAQEKAERRGVRIAELERPDTGLPETCDEHIRLMLDIVALAFQTDRTRVVSLIISRDGSAFIYPFLGLTNHHHAYSHENGGSKNFKKITIFKVQQLAYLANKLAAMPEGSSTVLDNSCLMMLSSMRDGWTHNAKALPVITLGGLGGSLETGRTLDYQRAGNDDRVLSGLYLGLMQRMGVQHKQFGEANAPLAGL